MKVRFDENNNTVKIHSRIEELDVVRFTINLMKAWGWDITKMRKQDTTFIAKLDEAADYSYFHADINSAKQELRAIGLSVR